MEVELEMFSLSMPLIIIRLLDSCNKENLEELLNFEDKIIILAKRPFIKNNILA